MSEPIRVPQPIPDPPIADGANTPRLVELAQMVCDADVEVETAQAVVNEIIEELRPLEIEHHTATNNNETSKLKKLEKKIDVTRERLRSAETELNDAQVDALGWRNEMTEKRAKARQLQRQLIAADEHLLAWSKEVHEKLTDATGRVKRLHKAKDRIGGFCRKLAALIEEVPAAVQAEVDAAELVKRAQAEAAEHRDGNTADLAGMTIEEARADLKKGSDIVAEAHRVAKDATDRWCELQAAIFDARKEVRRQKRLWHNRAPGIEAELVAVRKRLSEGLREHERLNQRNRDRLQALVGVTAEGVRGVDPVAVLEVVGGELPSC